jgi:hypothetical protein
MNMKKSNETTMRLNPKMNMNRKLNMKIDMKENLNEVELKHE